MSEFYNEVIKNKYLGEMENEGTANTISYAFKASKVTEEILEKDMYNFTDEEVFLVIKNLSSKTYNGVRANINYIKNYISWCIKNGYRENNINPLDAVNPKIYGQLIDRGTKIHYSYEEFIDLLDDPHMYNGQDQALLFLLFEGVMGRGLDEIRDLTFNDVDWDNNEIYIKSRDQKIKVSNDCIKYLDKAYKQNTYYSYVTKKDDFKEKELLPSPYIFKNIKSARAIEGEQISNAVLYGRLNAIKDEFDLEYLTPNAIKQSGMIWESVKLYKEYGKLEYEQFEKIGKKYNFSQLHSNGYTYYNTNLMRQFINEQNFKELYNLDVKF